MHTETWKETCTALQMTPQCSPFQWAQAGASIEVHRRLLRWRTPYLRVEMMGERAGQQLHQLNIEPQWNEDDEAGTA